VVYGGLQTFTLQNGFDKEFEVLYEVPKQYKDVVEKINNLVENVNNIDRDVYETRNRIKDNDLILKDIFDSWFNELNSRNKEVDETDGGNAHRKELPSNDTEILDSSLKDNIDEELSISKDYFFTEKEGKFYIYGITLGDSINKVLKLHGTPIDKSVDEYELDNILEYENFQISYVDDTVTKIKFHVFNDSMELEFFRIYDGDIYFSDGAYGESSDYYFYEPGSEQVLIFKCEEDPAMGFTAFLSYIDGNFQYNLEDGFIQPFERR